MRAEMQTLQLELEHARGQASSAAELHAAVRFICIPAYEWGTEVSGGHLGPLSPSNGHERHTAGPYFLAWLYFWLRHALFTSSHSCRPRSVMCAGQGPSGRGHEQAEG